MGKPKKATKKPTRRLAFLASRESLITSFQREQQQRQPAWQRQQPEQQRQRAWQRQQPEQRRELQQEPERQELQREPELQRASALPSCRKRKQRVQREQQPGEIVSLLISLIDK